MAKPEGAPGSANALQTRLNEEQVASMRAELRAEVLAELRREIRPAVEAELRAEVEASILKPYRDDVERKTMEFLQALTPYLKIFQFNRVRLAEDPKMSDLLRRFPSLHLTNDGKGLTFVGFMHGLMGVALGKPVKAVLESDGRFGGWEFAALQVGERSALTAKKA